MIIIMIDLAVILEKCNPIGLPKPYSFKNDATVGKPPTPTMGGEPQLQPEKEYNAASHPYNASFSFNINSARYNSSPVIPKQEFGSATPQPPLSTYEQDVSAARKAVFGIVGKISGLTLQQQLLVCKTLVNNTGDLELFSSLPDVARAEFVRMMLAGEL